MPATKPSPEGTKSDPALTPTWPRRKTSTSKELVEMESSEPLLITSRSMDDLARFGNRSFARRHRGLVLRVIRLLLVFTFFEDGVRMVRHPQGQARAILGLRFQPHHRLPAALAPREAWVPFVKGFLLALGAAQVVGSLGVVAPRDPRRAALSMSLLVIINALLCLNPFIEAEVHVHGVAAYVCRCGGSFAGLATLVAHADADRGDRSPSALRDPDVRARTRGGYVTLVARCLIAAYFPFSGIFSDASRPTTVVGILGAVALACGAATAVVSALLLTLMVLQGYAYYSVAFRHGRDRDALRFALAQDVSVLAALLLLAVTGPGHFSLDAKRKER